MNKTWYQIESERQRAEESLRRTMQKLVHDNPAEPGAQMILQYLATTSRQNAHPYFNVGTGNSRHGKPGAGS